MQECLEICYEEGTLYSGKLYSQAGGAPTGHPISSVIQNVILSTYEQEIFNVHKQNGVLKIFQRWVDDIFCRLPKNLHEDVLKQLNDFDPDQKLQFTCELATQVEPDLFRLPFLDFQVDWATDQDGNQISCATSVFRKATACRTMKPFTDHGPTAWKTANLVWFLRRAVSHSSSRQIMHQELEHLRHQFAEAGYPHSLISKKIQQTLEAMLGYGQHHIRDVPSSDENVSNRWLVLSLPWCGEQADKAISRIRRLLPRDVCRISISYTTSKFFNLLPSFRPSQPDVADKKAHIFRQANLVYKYSCPCGKYYIGETMRRLATRAAEHGDPESKISSHLHVCGQDFDMTRFEVIARNLKGWDARKKYETLYIRDLYKKGLAMNTCESSKNLCVL